MATDLGALQAAIKLVVDATEGEIKAFSSGSVAAGQGAVLAAALPDVMKLLPLIGEIPAEVSALQAADYGTLLTGLAADLNFASPKIEAYIAAALPVLSAILAGVPAIIAASKL